MRETELKIMFPTEKLEALRFFMRKKELDIEREMKDYLEKTYERIVPVHVREYVESRIGQEPAQEQMPGPEAQERQTEPQRQPRQTRRQREQAATEAPSSPQAQTGTEGPAEEETQGMTMSM